MWLNVARHCDHGFHKLSQTAVRAYLGHRDRFVIEDASGGSQLVDPDCVAVSMDKNALPNVMAERHRLRANLWRRDAESTTNRHLSELMLHSAYELEAEAAGLAYSEQTSATPCE
jgi:hypothetical protein